MQIFPFNFGLPATNVAFTAGYTYMSASGNLQTCPFLIRKGADDGSKKKALICEQQRSKQRKSPLSHRSFCWSLGQRNVLHPANGHGVQVHDPPRPPSVRQELDCAESRSHLVSPYLLLGPSIQKNALLFSLWLRIQVSRDRTLLLDRKNKHVKGGEWLAPLKWTRRRNGMTCPTFIPKTIPNGAIRNFRKRWAFPKRQAYRNNLKNSMLLSTFNSYYTSHFA